MPAGAPTVIIIAGPTASGKTELSYTLAQQLPIEIINADVGQFYEPLSVGTAKPDWRTSSIPHHLFDIIDQPDDLDVYRYQRDVHALIEQIHKRGATPVLVGGSFFYIATLFEKLDEGQVSCTMLRHAHYRSRLSMIHPEPPLGVSKDGNDALWQMLHTIDPERAAKIHRNDTYRLKRALHLWRTKKIQPSALKPSFHAPFNLHFIMIVPEREHLFARINARTEQMMQQVPSWLDEARGLAHTPWKDFLKRKKLIGYPEIFAWLDAGQPADQYEALVAAIQAKTRQYAKRQLMFWKTLRKRLEHGYKNSSFSLAIQVISHPDDFS